MPRTKNHPRKKARTEASVQISFRHQRFQDRYNFLKKKAFGTVRTIDWDVLKTLHLDGQIRGYLDQNGWSKVFAIDEPTYLELTLEVLASFDFDNTKARMQQPGAVKFQVFGEQQVMSLGQLAFFMGYYSEDFLTSLDFTTLALDLPDDTIADSYWRDLTDGADSYNKKATKLKDPGHRYLQILTSRSICGRNDSTGVCSRADLVVMHSLITGRPHHLGHLIARSLHHQGLMLRSTAIFAGPWVTRLIRGMGLIERTAGMERVGAIAPITMQLLRQIRFVVVQRDRFILLRVGEDGEEVAVSSSSEESDDDDDDEETPTATQPSSSRSPSAVLARIERLETQLTMLAQRSEERHREAAEDRRLILELLRGAGHQAPPAPSSPISPAVIPPPGADPAVPPEPTPASPSSPRQADPELIVLSSRSPSPAPEAAVAAPVPAVKEEQIDILS